MNFRFSRAESGEAHCLVEHGVDEREVEEALADPLEEWPGRGRSQIVHGRTEAGRYVKVVFLPDPEPDSVFVVTAYPIEGNALHAMRRRLNS